MAQAQLASGLAQSCFQTGAELLHRAMQVPQPQWLLHHRQHRDPVQGCGAIGRLLGIQPELQIQKPPQPLVPRAAAATEPQQVGHRGTTEQAAEHSAGPNGLQQLAEIPAVARRQHRLPRGEGPVAAVQALAELPEALTTGELLLTFLAPALRISPNPNRRLPIGEIHDTARIQGRGAWQRYVQFSKQALVAAALLKASDLGGAGIKGVGTASKGASAATALVVGLQQHHAAALTGQQRCPC